MNKNTKENTMSRTLTQNQMKSKKLKWLKLPTPLVKTNGMKLAKIGRLKGQKCERNRSSSIGRRSKRRKRSN